MARTALATLTAVAALASAAAPAHAGTVDVRVARDDLGRILVAHFEAAPGERNDVAVSSVSYDRVRVADAGAPLTAGRGCRQVDASTAVCGVPDGQDDVDSFLDDARLLLGDEDDRLVERTPRGAVELTVDAGPGDDVVHGGAAGDVLDGGGGGHDRLHGHAGEDLVRDGDDPAAPDADVLDGGGIDGHVDRVSYAGRTAPVTVALAGDGPAGQPGEDDRLQGFQSAVGGSGDDRLTGTAHGDRLAGGDGEDRIDGLAGDDGLDGGRGRDRLRGGAGDDGLDGDAGPNRLSGGPGGDWFTEPLAADHLSCGPGTDALANPAALIRVAPACERLRYAFAGRAVDIGLDPHPRAASPAAVRLRMGCPRFETMDGLCPMRLTGVLELRSAGRPHVLLGSAPQRWTLDGDDRPVHTGATIPLTAAGRRLAGRPRGVEARVRLTLGSLEPMRWVTRVRVG